MPEINTSVQATSDYTVEMKANEEGVKLYYDTCKHVTTLSTGAVLLLAAFIGKIAPTPHWSFLVVLTPCSFIASMFFSVFAMLRFAEIVRSMGKLSEQHFRTSYRIFRFSLWCFAWGILCLVSFAIINFYYR